MSQWCVVAAAATLFVFYKGLILAGHITSLRFQKKNKERVNVYLDDEYAFALPVLTAAQLRRGQFLDDGEIAQLRMLDLEAKAYDRALHFLAARPRSEWEIRRKLEGYQSRDGHPLDEDQTTAIIERLKAQNYVDDEAFAQYWVDQRNRFKPKSPRALQYELRRKGVAVTIIEAVINAETEPVTAALDAARQRAYRWYDLPEQEFHKKMVAFLQRRGFGWDVVQEVVARVWQEREQP